ncbi:MAG: hypothetical protein NVSMB14_17780 [Isosphaeraceae bacterium]
MIPPLNPQVRELIDRSQADAPFRAFVEARRNRYRNLIVIDAERSGYHAGLFTDMVHLNRRGAICLSLDVARVLRRVLAGESLAGLRINLPKFRDRSNEIRELAIEDLGQSMEIVKQTIAKQKKLRR